MPRRPAARGRVVPRLSLHGNNRTENLGLCVMCHNPNQTDVPYRYQTAGTIADPRIAGTETPIDFKVLVHSIHAGGFRTAPFVVIGFGSSVNDFSDVRFPRELRNCVNCHIDANGKGTFELPIRTTLGTTVNTQSTYLVPPGAHPQHQRQPLRRSEDDADGGHLLGLPRQVRGPEPLVKTGGASFATSQANIGTTVKEKCANCHGPGKEKDVRKVPRNRQQIAACASAPGPGLPCPAIAVRTQVGIAPGVVPGGEIHLLRR